MLKPDLSLPIGVQAPPGLVLVHEDHASGVAEYVFCAGVTPAHARELTARARELHGASRRLAREGR